MESFHYLHSFGKGNREVAENTTVTFKFSEWWG
jgi:hypothetical protein